MKGNRVALLSIAFVILLAGAVWVSAAQTKASVNNINPSSPNNQHQPTNWERVDRAARNLNNSDETSVRALVNEVLADDGISENIIPTAGPLPGRLVAAEIAYQKGTASAISEERVVSTVNYLAQRFNAPPYAYTDVKQLRRLRLRMLTVYPNLIGRGSKATRDDSKPHFERTMGPIEAFHVTATLVFQKLTNPEFQFSRQEMETASQKDASTAVGELTRSVAQGDRTREILKVVSDGAASISLRDLLDASAQSLDRLGIPR